MKSLLVIVVTGFCIMTVLFWKVVLERDTLRDRLSQQSYQLEALVMEYNRKRPGDSAELMLDGTVSYWRNYSAQHEQHEWVLVYDTLNIVTSVETRHE